METSSAARRGAHRRLLDNAKLLHGGVFRPFAASVLHFGDQCRQIVAEARRLKLPPAYRNCTNVIINGMGGSGLGADILVAAFADRLRCPVTLTHSYDVPGFVNGKTFYLACSYSGNTEEVVAALAPARKRRAKIAVLTTGGALAQAAHRAKIPALVFSTTYNPSAQPRLGLGYSLCGTWAMLGKARVLPYTAAMANSFVTASAAASARFAPFKPVQHNRAKQLALAISGRLPLVITGGNLAGVAHAFSNSCHESAKHFTLYQTLPELNHHLLEGLKHPAAARSLIAVFGESPNDPLAIQRRAAVTAQVFARHDIPVLRYRTENGLWITQAGELLQLALYTSWYLAALNRVNPQAIPWVDFFKAKLAKR